MMLFWFCVSFIMDMHSGKTLHENSGERKKQNQKQMNGLQFGKKNTKQMGYRMHVGQNLMCPGAYSFQFKCLPGPSL